MPIEVLSYFLKHEDYRLKLHFQIILQCAPFLKGIKVSCGITIEERSYSELRHIFNGTGISFVKLLESDGKCLVLFYREKELGEYLNRIGTRSFVRQYGYEEMTLEEMLRRLKMRILAFEKRGIGFPHEIGLFLGYPIEDVKGFIENEGKNYLLAGYWKVYSNPAAAKMIFNEYDQAKTCAVNEFLTGRSIQEIAHN